MKSLPQTWARGRGHCDRPTRSTARKPIGLWDVLPTWLIRQCPTAGQARKGGSLGSVASASLELKSFDQRVKAESEVSMGLSDCELGTIALQVGVPTWVIGQWS